jgi:hypothetical protein
LLFFDIDLTGVDEVHALSSSIISTGGPSIETEFDFRFRFPFFFLFESLFSSFGSSESSTVCFRVFFFFFFFKFFAGVRSVEPCLPIPHTLAADVLLGAVTADADSDAQKSMRQNIVPIVVGRLLRRIVNGFEAIVVSKAKERASFVRIFSMFNAVECPLEPAWT